MPRRLWVRTPQSLFFFFYLFLFSLTTGVTLKSCVLKEKMDNEQNDNGLGEPTQKQLEEEQAYNDAQMASLAEVKKRRKA